MTNDIGLAKRVYELEKYNLDLREQLAECVKRDNDLIKMLQTQNDHLLELGASTIKRFDCVYDMMQKQTPPTVDEF